MCKVDKPHVWLFESWNRNTKILSFESAFDSGSANCFGMLTPDGR